jgi:hypothetical protein
MEPGKSTGSILRPIVVKKDLRYTVQMFKLIGSPVLDPDQAKGLLTHLNETEFLSLRPAQHVEARSRLRSS